MFQNKPDFFRKQLVCIVLELMISYLDLSTGKVVNLYWFYLVPWNRGRCLQSHHLQQ